MKVQVTTLNAEAKGEIELNDHVFGVEPRADILHRVVTWQLEKRRGTARGARERADVARTGKKFGKQKGGGTARHGDRRAPIFVGGGKAHGPRVRDFDPSLNKKVRALGLKMALSSKARDGKLIVIENSSQPKPRPRRCASSSPAQPRPHALVIDGDALSVGFARRRRTCADRPAAGGRRQCVRHLKHETLVLTRAAVEKLEARFNG
jgi:large subunit ribosomal protein L4